MYEYKLTISFNNKHRFTSIETILPWLRFCMRRAKNIKIHDAVIRDITKNAIVEFEDNKHKKDQNAV